jgi:hypothetical protein
MGRATETLVLPFFQALLTQQVCLVEGRSICNPERRICQMAYSTLDRKAFVRSCRGLSSTPRGRPDSTMTPPTMKINGRRLVGRNRFRGSPQSSSSRTGIITSFFQVGVRTAVGRFAEGALSATSKAFENQSLCRRHAFDIRGSLLCPHTISNTARSTGDRLRVGWKPSAMSDAPPVYWAFTRTPCAIAFAVRLSFSARHSITPVIA